MVEITLPGEGDRAECDHTQKTQMHAFSEPPISRTAAGAYADSKKTAHAQAAQIVQVSPLPSIAARSPWPLVFVAPIFSDISSS